VQDADEPVAEYAEGLMVQVADGASLVLERGRAIESVAHHCGITPAKAAI
jgi:hypothetical protein